MFYQWEKDPALLWLWCRPVVTAPIRPLAWAPPYASDAALEKTKGPKKKKIKAWYGEFLKQKQTKKQNYHVTAIPLLDRYSKELKAGTQTRAPPVHSSIIHNS